MFLAIRRVGTFFILPLLSIWILGCGAFSGGGNHVSPPVHIVPPQAGIGYTPAQIRHAYGIDQLSTTGAGQTIAIVDAFGSPTLQQDLNTFNARYGLPPASLTIAYPDGQPPMTDSGWALETSLDVEWAHAVAPNANILLVIAPSSTLINLLDGVDYAAQHAAQVSMSWGGDEMPDEVVLDAHFNRPGVTFFAAAGDTGPGVSWPAASPFVIGVGGTTLRLTAANTRSSEIAWSSGGGGQSQYETEPSFQLPWQTSGSRQVPDVSYDADLMTGFMVFDSTPVSGQSGWVILGGTSAGTSQWTALWALANAGRITPLSGNAALYTLGSPATLHNYFFDVTSGGNSKFSAGPGYDMVTGLGTPLANTLIPKLMAF